MCYENLYDHLQQVADPKIAAHSQRFFKTGPGEYGEGDQFLGIRVPILRKAARRFRDLPRSDITRLLKSPLHEVRLTGLLVLVSQFEGGSPAQQESIYKYYLRNARCINNWDLVDTSAHQIVGGWLLERGKGPLDVLARSQNLWERRIAIVATYHFIKRDLYAPTLQLSKRLLRDEQDLIHKAVGWMLREVGNRDRQLLESFLKEHYATMPRTMLRYAIERLPERRRKAYLAGRV
jgi:3-methyladenine DNA glycosylase AlkD